MIKLDIVLREIDWFYNLVVMYLGWLLVCNIVVRCDYFLWFVVGSCDVVVIEGLEIDILVVSYTYDSFVIFIIIFVNFNYGGIVGGIFVIVIGFGFG